MEKLLAEIRQCKVCADYLPLGPNPILAASPKSKIVIIGQAPGKVVHQTSIPWNDKSGDNLRKWLGVDSATFYDADKIALMPMGFCYPGTGKSGDLAPRAECAPLWHSPLMEMMVVQKLVILIGQYAQNYYLGKSIRDNLTETVRNFQSYLPRYLPLPHPSPRNNIWQKKNEWFVAEVLPALKERVGDILRA